MSRLRRAVMSQIHSALDNSLFTAWDFAVEYPDNGPNLVTIRFSPSPQYTFVIQDHREGYFSIQNPGVSHVQESYTYSNMDTCVREITNWCKRVREELVESGPKPLYEEIEALRKQVNESLSQQSEELKGFFNKEEIDKLYEKLESLKNDFDLLREKQTISESVLSKAKNDIEEMKKNLHSFSKNVWYRTAANKCFGLFIRIAGSKEGRELAVNTAKALLPNSGESSQTP